MGLRSKYLLIAVPLTVLDLAVAVRYGGVIWRALSGIIWNRVTLFFLAALWLTSLLHLWGRAYCEFRGAVEPQAGNLSPRVVAGSARPREDSDV